LSHIRLGLTICRTLVVAAMAALTCLGACDDGDGGPVEPEPECAVAADCEARLLATSFAPACTSMSCDAGKCVFSGAEKAGQPCDDGQSCTDADLCVARQCIGTAKVCDDQEPCTNDRCEGATGECVHTVAAGNLCDDGIECTETDRCGADGSCQGQPTEACECIDDSDCDAALSTNLCDGPLACGPAYRCQVDPANRIVCDDSEDSTCLEAACEPSTGQCLPTARNEGVSCDTNPCVVGGTCASGACVGPARDCDDGNVCTLDGCDAGLAPAEVCVHSPTGGLCNDGDPCTVDDFCEAGGCVGAPKPCDDQNECTADACEGGSGQCLHTNILGPCDDGVPCTVDDACGGAVEGGGEVVPDGQCQGQPMSCDDGNVCTSDACLNAAGKALCQHLPVPGACDDGEACTVSDFCLGGQCTAGSMICDCLVDADCDPLTAADPCPGERACEDSVFPYQCDVIAGTAVSCETPADPCEIATCVPATGACAVTVLADGKPCDDADACTTSSLCIGAACVAQGLVDCDDGDACTSNVCDEGDCLSVPLDDDEVLLAADFDGGFPAGWTTKTTSGPAASWAVATSFTPNATGLGAVATGLGEQYGGPVVATLTTPEFIVRGSHVRLSLMTKVQVAQPGCGTDKLVVAAVSYGDVVPVLQVCATEAAWTLHELSLDDFRDRPTRLVFTFEADATENGGFGAAIDDVVVEGLYVCDDADACTTADRCALGLCGGVATVCDDGDPCTNDHCDASSGACVFEQAPACACSVDEDCPSAGPCISRTCGAAGLCVDTVLAGPCSDGSLCTQGDTCQAGVCVGGPVDCADSDACTADGCDPATGCVHAPADGPPCDDQDPCTVADACVAGACVGAPKSCDLGSECTVGQCVAGACEYAILQDGQKVFESKFDSVGPGKLPPGFSVTDGLPEFTWATSTGLVVSAPNALASVLPATWAGGTVRVQTPAFAVPDDGGTLTASIRAVLADGSCTADVLRVWVGDDVVAEQCDDTSGFAPLSVDLTAYAGQTVAVAFELVLGPGSAGDVDVRVDDFKVTGRYLCDDAKVCTTNDVCVLGSCKGTSIPNCP
jgi:hypothetical protein